MIVLSCMAVQSFTSRMHLQCTFFFFSFFSATGVTPGVGSTTGCCIGEVAEGGGATAGVVSIPIGTSTLQISQTISEPIKL